MFKKIILISLLICTAIFAQNTVRLNGRIHDKSGKALIGVNIQVEGFQKGAASDIDGKFYIDFDKSEKVNLIISHIGYKTETISASTDEEITIRLESSVEQLDAVEVSAVRESHLSADGTVIGSYELAQRREAGYSSLGQILTGVSGANLKICCALSGKTALSLLGLPGAYTEITVDNAPEVCGLASSYRLYSYPAIGIQKMEIRKGAGNVMSEAKALGGHINIQTRKPTPGPVQGSVAVYHRTVGGQEMQLELSNEVGGVGVSTAFSVSNGDEFDRDDDGWSEAPSNDRKFFRLKLTRGNSSGINGSLSGLMLNDQVTGGMTDVDREDIGDEPFWVKSVFTKRYESTGELNFPIRNSNLRLSGTIAHVELDQIVGIDNTLINENGFVTELEYDMPFFNGSLTSATTYRHEEIDELDSLNGLDRTDDLVSFKIRDSREILPNLKSKIGFRVDGKSGTDIDEREWNVFPRVNLEYKPRFDLMFTGSVGSGGRFRPSAQDLLDGYDNEIVVQVPNDLKGENGWTSAFGAEWKLFDDKTIYTLGGTGWYSNIQDRILPFSTGDGVLSYTNATGATKIAGGDIQFMMDYPNGILVHMGAEYNYSEFTNNGTSSPLPFTPDWRGFARFDWHDIAGINGLKFWVMSTAYGPQSLPENSYGMDKSDPFVTSDATVGFRTGAVSIMGGVRNFLDVTQEISPLQGTADPFASGVSTELLYGPLVGRTFVASMVFHFGAPSQVLRGMGYGGMNKSDDCSAAQSSSAAFATSQGSSSCSSASSNPKATQEASSPKCSHSNNDISEDGFGRELGEQGTNSGHTGCQSASPQSVIPSQSKTAEACAISCAEKAKLGKDGKSSSSCCPESKMTAEECAKSCAEKAKLGKDGKSSSCCSDSKSSSCCSDSKTKMTAEECAKSCAEKAKLKESDSE